MGLPVEKQEKGKVMISRADMGRPDSLRHHVITMIRDENYDRAVEHLQSFLERPSDYPRFKGRVERYIGHAIDLVRAIEMKRNFPGLGRMTAARQQDLKLKVKQHIDELVYSLKKVERVEVNLKIEDVRSTVILVHAVVLSSFAIAVVAFINELSQGLMMNFVTVVDDIYQDLAQRLFSLLG